MEPQQNPASGTDALTSPSTTTNQHNSNEDEKQEGHSTDDSARLGRTDQPPKPPADKTAPEDPQALGEEMQSGPANTNTPQKTEPDSSNQENYSIFTVREKRILVALAALAALFSPLSANIYYAATTTLARDLNTSIDLINLTVTCYLIFQGLSPTFVGSISDDIGRRPVYLVCFVLYLGANIGLALQHTYAALFVLRCLQSAGISGTAVLANALVSDIVTSAQRGSYMSYVSMGVMVGPSFGPVIGGLLARYINWQSIFWFLTIFGAVTFAVVVCFLPETNRKIVGNGSLPPQRWNYSLLSYYRLQQARKQGATPRSISRLAAQKRPQLLQSIYIFADRESAVTLFYSAVFFAGYYLVITSLPSQLEKVYGFDSLKIGLCYIPSGLGSFAASLGMGRFMDWNFRRHARYLGMSVSKTRQQDLRGFPIEKARLQVIFPNAFLASGSVIAYGFLIQYHVNIAGPLVFLFFATFFITCSFQGLNTLVVDLNRDKPSSAAAAMNLARCWLGAGAAAVAVPLINAIGVGWTCVIAAGVWIALSPVVLGLIKYGPVWREEKAKRLEEAAASSAAARA